MSGCKETICTSCAHREVCKFCADFLKAQKAVDDVMVVLGKEQAKMLRDFDYIKPVELQCKHWKLHSLGGGIR